MEADSEAETAETASTAESASVRPDGSKRRREGHAPGEQPRHKAPRRLRLTGECIDWCPRRGWGFVRRDDLGPTLFVHHTGIDA